MEKRESEWLVAFDRVQIFSSYKSTSFGRVTHMSQSDQVQLSVEGFTPSPRVKIHLLRSSLAHVNERHFLV